MLLTSAFLFVLLGFRWATCRNYGMDDVMNYLEWRLATVRFGESVLGWLALYL